MHFTYRTRGTCSQQILFDVDGKTVRNIEFIGGCNGNLQGISRLVEGWTSIPSSSGWTASTAA